jgi:hypothetical protein
MSRDVAPLIAAEALLHHGLSDDAVVGYLARTWPLGALDCRAAVNAAHILLRRERAEAPSFTMQDNDSSIRRVTGRGVVDRSCAPRDGDTSRAV